MPNFDIAPPKLDITPPSRRSTTRKPSADKIRQDRITRYRKTVDSTLDDVAHGLAILSEVKDSKPLARDATTITLTKTTLSEPLSEALADTPACVAYMDRAAKAAPWLAVGAGLVMVAVSLWTNHLSDEKRERLFGKPQQT